MARRESNWSLSIETGVEVKQDSLNKASRIFDAFYNKYNDKSVKINTSDLVATVRDSVSAIKQLYDEGTATPSSWLNTRPQMKATFDAILSDAEEMFSGIKVLFSDGSYVSGIDNILQGFRNQLSVVFSDIGGLYDKLNKKQKDLYVELNRSAYIDEDSYDRADILNRIDLLNDLIEVQKQMRDIHPSIQDREFAGSLNIDVLKDAVAEHKQVLDAMRDYGLETVQQVYQREKILKSVYNEPWGDRNQSIAKEKKNYDESIQSLDQYINERRQLLATLDDNDYTLFSFEGVEEYKSEVLRQISTLEYYKKELESLKKISNDNVPIGGNLSDVVEQLKEIKEAITAIKTAFEPLTNALSSEDNALHKMLTTSIEDLNALESRLKDVYQMIDTISKKEFNITQQTVYNTRASTSMQSNASFGAYKEKAQALIDVISKLVNLSNQLSYADSGLFANVINQLNAQGRMSEFFETLNGFDPANFAGKIAGAETNKDIKNIVGKLTVYKDMLLDVVNIINSVKPGTIDTSFLSVLNDADEKINKINSGIIDAQNLQAKGNQAKTNETAEKANEIGANTEEVVAKVKTLSEQIESELKSIRSQMESTFDFSTIDPKLENVKSITDAIYQQFVELQAKINALDLNLEIPAVVAKADINEKKDVTAEGSAAISANEVKTEADAMQDVKVKADGATKAKEKFAEANKKVAKTAEDTSDAVKEEAKKMEEAAGAIVEVSDKFDKIKYIENADGETISKTTTSTTKREKAIETESKYYTYEDGEEILQAVSIIKDFKKRAAELKKEADKIALAQKTVDKFLSQFESKTAGQANTIKGFSGEDGLKGFTIKNLDDIEKATQKMLELDNEYNKITKSFRQGTKSMNPFVNAITGIDEMANKVEEVRIDFTKLKSAPEGLAKEVANLNPLLKQMKDFISEDANGNKIITDIYGLADAYGKLNVALRKANSDIALRGKIEAAAEKEGKQSRKNYEDAIKLQDKLYKAKKQLAVADDGSVEESELSRKVKELQAEYDATMNLLKGKAALVTIREREAVLQKEVDATVEEKARSEQAEKLLSVYKEYADLRENIARMDNDMSGKVHDQERAKAIEDMANAARKLKDAYGIDVSDESSLFESLSKNNILTQEQMVDLLDEDIKRRQKIVNLMRQASDAESTRAKKEQQKQENKNQAYGKPIYNREAKYFETINAKATKLGSDTGLSDDFLTTLERHKVAFKELEDLREQFANNPDAFNNEALRGKFQSTAVEIEGLRKEILSTFKEAEKFEKLSASGAVLGDATIDADRFENAKMAMIDFAATVTGGQLKLEGFNAAGTEMYGTLDKGGGTVDKVTVKLREGTNQLYAYTSGTKQTSSSWQQLGKSLTDGAKRLATMYLSLYDIIRYVRKGVGYVKEIDLALTELKKVTDETEESYKNFLKTASSTSAVIGSTVSDFTDATAAFARLGYSIDESSKMAETAIVYKNVADGLDTVEESTESIISTMKAYGIEANDTMGIIDRFNAVGNNFAITSAGIGEAMQRSASALYEGGNSIDESIGLITAANSVIQNPEQVGELLADYKVA